MKFYFHPKGGSRNKHKKKMSKEEFPIPAAVLKHAQELGDGDLLVALEAASLAAAKIHYHYHAAVPAVEEKPGMHGDLVSVVDKEADEAILGHLRSRRPGDLILSEELQPDTRCAEGERLWIVDPLDGTVGFLFRASPEYPSTLVALRCGGRTLVAVVWFGVTGQVFYAVNGRGAFLNGSPLSVSADASRTTLCEAWVDMNHYSDVLFETAPFTRLRKQLRTKQTGARLVTSLPAHSGIACHIALGHKRVHAIVHDNNPANVKQGPWDAAAPQLVLEEAGGVFLNGATGEQYDPLDTAGVIVAAASRQLANQILTLLKTPLSE